MFSESNAAHPVGFDSQSQIIMAVWHTFLIFELAICNMFLDIPCIFQHASLLIPWCSMSSPTCSQPTPTRSQPSPTRYQPSPILSKPISALPCLLQHAKEYCLDWNINKKKYTLLFKDKLFPLSPTFSWESQKPANEEWGISGKVLLLLRLFSVRRECRRKWLLFLLSKYDKNNSFLWI